MDRATQKQLKRIGHSLHPVVMVSEKGLHDNALHALEQALTDHELIKVKIAIMDRDKRKLVIDSLLQASHSQLIQAIGKVVLIYRPSPHKNKRLSNVQRYLQKA